MLRDWSCAACDVTFGTRNGIPDLLSRDPRFASAAGIATTYDDIYTHHTQVWEDQGRTPAFMRYYAELAAACGVGRLLEIGCGEGYLLEQLRATEKVAVDISSAALKRAVTRTGARASVALAERLPFASGTFDVVVTVGVMEHFLDPEQATREIARVLRPGGCYLALLHVERSRREKAAQKVREFIYPRFRPAALARWIGKKLHRPVQQPIQHDYTQSAARALLERGGFRVERTISIATDPEAPLIGPHVSVFVARAAAARDS